MANFDQAYAIAINHEQGYVFNLGDGAGETYRGITRKNHPDWEGWRMIDGYKRKGQIRYNTVFANKQLEDLVKKFYKAKYWDAKLKGDMIISQQLANFLFDFVINAENNAIRKINTAVTTIKAVPVIPTQLSQDTVLIMNRVPERAYQEIYKGRESYYNEIASKNPSKKKFLNGWLNRLRSFPSQIKFNPNAANVLPTWEQFNREQMKRLGVYM